MSAVALTVIRTRIGDSHRLHYRPKRSSPVKGKRTPVDSVQPHPSSMCYVCSRLTFRFTTFTHSNFSFLARLQAYIFIASTSNSLFSFLHTYLVGVGMLKKIPDYRDATPLHIGVGISVKCPSGLLSAYFLAFKIPFHQCVLP